MTPAGIEPATFRFVAQHFNHRATAVPNFELISGKFNAYRIYAYVNTFITHIQ